MTTKDIGNKAEAMYIAEFLKYGIPISIPFGNSEPYDIIIKTKDGFKSVQIKHATYKNGCVVAYPKKFIGYNKKFCVTYEGLCDYIGLWCEEINKFYLLSMEECGHRKTLMLRVKPPEHGNKISTIVWADKYELKIKIKEL